MPSLDCIFFSSCMFYSDLTPCGLCVTMCDQLYLYQQASSGPREPGGQGPFKGQDTKTRDLGALSHAHALHQALPQYFCLQSNIDCTFFFTASLCGAQIYLRMWLLIPLFLFVSQIKKVYAVVQIFHRQNCLSKCAFVIKNSEKLKTKSKGSTKLNDLYGSCFLLL